MNFKFIILTLYTSLVTCIELDDNNECYREIKPKLGNLTALCHNPPSVLNVSEFPDIILLIKEVEDIISDIMQLDTTLENSEVINTLVINKSNIVVNLEDNLDLLKLIMNEIDEMNIKKEFHNKAYNTCSDANELFEKLSKDIDDIKLAGNTIQAVVEKITKLIKEVNNVSTKVKNDLEIVNVPKLLYKQYVCDFNLLSKIEDIIISMRNIAELLRQNLEEIIQQELQEIENDNIKTESDINEMGEKFNQELPTTNVKINEDTQSMIENLQKHIRDLKDIMAQIKLSDNNDFLKSVEDKFKNLAKEYEAILNHLFSKEVMDKVAKELETSQKSLKIIKERDMLNEELDSVKKIVDSLKKGGVCLRDKVTVEE